jgi:hypothetical protein
MITKLWHSGTVRVTLVVVAAFIVCALAFFATWYLPLGKITYPQKALVAEVASTTEPTPTVPAIPAHIPTPDSVRAIYMTSWAAGHPKFLAHLFDIVENTEINAVVIDIKDYTGRIAYEVDDPELAKYGSVEKRIPDIKALISKLHERNIYVIGRISTFQDSYLVKVHPEWAVKTKAGAVWQDYKGVKWLDAGAKPVWDYVIAIGKDAYAQGFDELNYDYIRFPSDGPMKDISYTWDNGKSRQVVMREFFEYVHSQFKDTPIVTSADFFGLVTSSNDDLGIGQVLEDALHNFDYVAPMVYPSHFGKGYRGIEKPATEPYNVIKYSMESGIQKAIAATSSPQKLRPWLQAFDLGADYTPAMVRAQIQATYDVGLTGWMLWNAGSIYDKDALLPKSEMIP